MLRRLERPGGKGEGEGLGIGGGGSPPLPRGGGSPPLPRGNQKKFAYRSYNIFYY